MSRTQKLVATILVATVLITNISTGQVNYNTLFAPGAGSSGRIGIGPLGAGNVFNPQDLLHIHGWTVGGVVPPFYYEPILRLSLEDPFQNPSRAFGQLGMQNFDERVNPNPFYSNPTSLILCKKI